MTTVRRAPRRMTTARTTSTTKKPPIASPMERASRSPATITPNPTTHPTKIARKTDALPPDASTRSRTFPSRSSTDHRSPKRRRRMGRRENRASGANAAAVVMKLLRRAHHGTQAVIRPVDARGADGDELGVHHEGADRERRRLSIAARDRAFHDGRCAAHGDDGEV